MGVVETVWETLALAFVSSRPRLGAAVGGGGGIEVAALLVLDVASKGCLDAGLFEFAPRCVRGRRG